MKPNCKRTTNLILQEESAEVQKALWDFCHKLALAESYEVNDVWDYLPEFVHKVNLHDSVISAQIEISASWYNSGKLVTMMAAISHEALKIGK